jgi:L-threonylcarbamoyladenylate synthase
MHIISKCTQEATSKAAQALVDGHLVAFPTETVYGLGADANNSKAVARIYKVKARPTDHPLIVHISSINQIVRWATDIPDYAITLARKFWPGPMTLILKRNKDVKDSISGGQGNIGVRVPNNEYVLELLKKFESLGGSGVAAPSANKYKSISPTSALDVWKELGDQLTLQDMILDGGSCELGIESTIINCLDSRPTILRPGWITPQMINNVFGTDFLQTNLRDFIKHSGSDLNHYLPKTPVMVNVQPLPGDGLIALSKIQTPKGVYRLSSPKTLESLAYGLYASFRNADELRLNNIVVILSEIGGLAEAIMDRVKRAATLS